jgi:hypothetical protein
MLGLGKGSTVSGALHRATRELQQRHNPHLPSELQAPDDKPAGQPSAAPREVKADEPPAGTPPPVTPAPQPAEPAADGQPPKPAEPPAPPVTPPPAPKVKVGEDEYTPEELQKLVTAAKPAGQQPPASPAQPEAAKPATPQGPTPEELAEFQKQFNANREKFINDHLPRVGQYLESAVSETDMEVIANGGAEGVAKLREILGKSVLNAVVLARQAAFTDLTPQIRQIAAQLRPLAEERQQQRQQQARQEAEVEFAKTYPHLEKQLPLANQIADAIFQQHPDWAAQASRADLFKEVARQMERFGFTAAPAAPQKVSVNGREYTVEELAALIPGVTPPPAAPVPPAPAAPPMPPPPAGNFPGVMGGAPAAKGRNPIVAATLGIR